MKIKMLAATAALALAAVTAAPATAGGLPVGGCDAHIDTVFGGICIPTP